MHDHLFSHQAELGANWYPTAARELGLAAKASKAPPQVKPAAVTATP